MKEDVVVEVVEVDEECIEEDRRTHLDFEARQAESSAPTPQSQPRGGGKRESVGDAAAGPDPKKKKNNAALHKKMQKYLGMIAPVKLELQSYLTKASAGEMAKFVPAYVVSHAAALQEGEAPEGELQLPLMWCANGSGYAQWQQSIAPWLAGTADLQQQCSKAMEDEGSAIGMCLRVQWGDEVLHGFNKI